MSDPTLLAQCEAAYPLLRWEMRGSCAAGVAPSGAAVTISPSCRPLGEWDVIVMHAGAHLCDSYPTLSAALAAPREAARAAVAELTRKVAPLL